MKKFTLNKVVRDNIPALHVDDGGVAEFVELTGKQAQAAMVDKVHEEVAEALRNPNNAGEYADAVEALLGLAKAYGIERQEVFGALQKKSKKKGGFSRVRFVKEVSVPDDSWLAGYYASDPDRFEEI